jgi:hypothetical protein
MQKQVEEEDCNLIARKIARVVISVENFLK